MGSHRIYIFVLVQVYRRFKEVIIAVDWGQCGGFLAVAGSKGTLAIYSIDTSAGLIDVQYCEKKQISSSAKQDIAIRGVLWSTKQSELTLTTVIVMTESNLFFFSCVDPASSDSNQLKL